MFPAPGSAPGPNSRVRLFFLFTPLILAALSACSRPTEPETEEYPGTYAGYAVLRVKDGRLERWNPEPLAPREGIPASTAFYAATAAALDARSAVLAVNRAGMVRVRIDPGALRYRLEDLGSGEEFPGRSVGSLFVRENRVFCLLYRDFVFEREPPRNPPSILLALDIADPAGILRPHDLGPDGGDIFAVFPLSEGRWALHLRKDVPEGTESSFRLFDPRSGAFLPLERRDFEKLLSPRPLSAAPDSLRRAALLLAPEGCPVVVSASLADGGRAAYCFGEGRSEDTVELRGAVTEAGAAVTAWNAVAAVSGPGGQSSFRLPVPVEGAVYRDIVPLEGAVLALWELGVFPNLEESGAVLLPVP